MQKIKKTDKVLCICEGGNSRSVALAWLFKKQLDMDAIAVGIRENKEDTLEMLGDWADHVILTDKKLEAKLPESLKNGKLRVWSVGPDIYFQGFAESLMNKSLSYLEDEIEKEVK